MLPFWQALCLFLKRLGRVSPGAVLLCCRVCGDSGAKLGECAGILCCAARMLCSQIAVLLTLGVVVRVRRACAIRARRSGRLVDGSQGSEAVSVPDPAPA